MAWSVRVSAAMASSQFADATFDPVGEIEPLSEYSIMGGFVGHPIPAVDIYAYGGAEGADAKPTRAPPATATRTSTVWLLP